jgi:hypothetical protein
MKLSVSSGLGKVIEKNPQVLRMLGSKRGASTPSSSEWFLSFRLWEENFICIPAHFILLVMITVIISGEKAGRILRLLSK